MKRSGDSTNVILGGAANDKLHAGGDAAFDVVIGDEAHLFKAKSMITIMEKMSGCVYKFGFTGTLDGTQCHELILQGLFGPVRRVTTTAELIEQVAQRVEAGGIEADDPHVVPL